MKSTWEGILASIFDRFWRILEGNLEGKIEPRSIKNGIVRALKKKGVAGRPGLKPTGGVS